MKDTLHLETKVIGLLGHPLKHSLSPFIHNIACDLMNLDYIYLPFDVLHSNLKDALKGMLALGIKGFNVTIPHKESIISYLNEISEEASTIGSVNTIVNDNNKLIGYNTDVHGVMETLSMYKDEIGGNVVSVLGSGGASRAVIYSLVRNFKPSDINIINRTEQRAESLKRYFSDKIKFENFHVYELVPPDLTEVLQTSALIINTTPVGMNPDNDDSVIDLKSAFNKEQIVFDLVYNPVKSKLLQLASEQGARTINGIDMLVAQAAKSFELWTGHEMPIEKIKTAVANYLRE